MDSQMVTSQDCIDKYGYPTPTMERKHMVLWDVPDEINKCIPELPNRIYCNKDLVEPLEKAFNNIIERRLEDEIKTWDGCFNIRRKRGLKSWSLHSWAIAIDINATRNGLGQTPSMDRRLVACFTDAGFDWGGIWTRPDGMHFQLANI
jgi:hypothetical protein